MTWDLPCDHVNGDQVCGTRPTRAFLTGRRCQTHTPAHLAGRPEPGRTADSTWMTKVLAPAPMSASRLMDDRAIRSGKRRSSPQRYQEAKSRLDR